MKLLIADGLGLTILIRKIEKESNLKETPVIAVTASNPEKDKPKYISTGMNDFSRKQLSLTELPQGIPAWVNL